MIYLFYIHPPPLDILTNFFLDKSFTLDLENNVVRGTVSSSPDLNYVKESINPKWVKNIFRARSY